MKNIFYAILIQSEWQSEEDEGGVKLLPNYFGTYKKAVDEVKRKYPAWDDRYEDDGSLKTYPTSNKVEVEEGSKMGDKAIGGDPNLTELYIERGIYISIHKLVNKHKKPDAPPPPPDPDAGAAAGGGYTRRRQRKRNTKNTRKA
jgi:hypothetical protein